jgi:drug/metabolite transporter (DMT)-like permease
MTYSDCKTIPRPAIERQRLKGALMMLTAALLFAVLGLFIKILGSGYRVWDIAAYRFIGGALVLIAISNERGRLFRPLNPRLILIRGLTGSLAFLSIIIAIRQIPLSTAMVLFYSFPAFAALLSPLLFGERITPVELGCVLVAICGVAVIFDFNIEGTVFGQIMAVVGAVFAGLTISIIKKLRETHNSITIYFYFCLIGAILCVVPFLSSPHMPGSTFDWLIIGGILFTSVSAQLLMTTGFRYCKSWEGGLFMTSEVVFISIFGILFLNEVLDKRFFIGSFLILLSAVSFNLFNRPVQPPLASKPPQ